MNKLTRSLHTGLCLLLAMGVTGLAYADDQDFRATASGAQEVPEAVTIGKGRIEAKFDEGFKKLRVDLRIDRLEGAFTAAHFHCARPGENGPVAFGLVNPGPLVLEGVRIRGTLTNADFSGADCTDAIGRPVNNLIALALAMRDGLIYLNVHSDAVASGEIRAQMLEHDDADDVVAPASQ